MKPFSIILICLFLFSCKERKAANDWGKMELHGKVKTLVEKDYMLDTTGTNKGKHLRWTTTYSFNTQGLIMEKEQLEESGKLLTMSEYSYDTRGRLIQEKLTTREEQNRTIKYEYDSTGGNVIVRYLAPDGVAFNAEVHHYDKDKLLRKTTRCFIGDCTFDSFTYDRNRKLTSDIFTGWGNFRQRTRFSYDERYNCISEVSDTALPHRAIKTTRKFDEQDNLLEETSYEADGSIHSQKKIEYKSFDKAGNWLVQYIHWKDLGVTVVERAIQYYP